MIDVGRTLWNLCNTLRHDGMDYGQYLDQLTYLLFLKMADEKGLLLGGTGWAELRGVSADELINAYQALLATLASQDGLVGDVFHGAVSEFNRPESLRVVIDAIDEIHWGALDVEVQAAAFEYLLEQAASEGKKGAGQYFTPRELIETIVSCVKPGSQRQDFDLTDPASGTGGFLVAGYRWSRGPGSKRVPHISGTELVARPRRLAIMNLLLHGVDAPSIDLGDALESSTRKYAVVLSNPPFGVKGGRPPKGTDYWFATTNKQANFVQHIVGRLEDGGRAAIILPDNCFFGETSSSLWPQLVQLANVHTILRLPRGSFAPYTAGTQTNVIFLTKGISTTSVWTYDARSGVEPANRKNPLKRGDFAEFVACFGDDPNGLSTRSSMDSSDGRWLPHTLEQLVNVNFQMDKLDWRGPSESIDLSQAPRSAMESALADLEHATGLLREALSKMSKE